MLQERILKKIYESLKGQETEKNTSCTSLKTEGETEYSVDVTRKKRERNVKILEDMKL